MWLMIICGVLLAGGLAAIGLWGGKTLTPPAPANDGGAVLWQVARRVLWWANVVLTAGAAAGILMSGAGGRLIMRLLAVTSPEDEGRLTEAGETIGVISLEGTLGFLHFAGIGIGCATALLYAAVHRWLPRGRLGGLLFGLLLLVGLSTALEPLRPDNRDFQIVGPGWLSLLVFGLLAVAHGMLVAALAGRLGELVPLLGPSGRRIPFQQGERTSALGGGQLRGIQILAYVPLLVVLALLGPAGLVLAGGILLIVLLGTAARLLLPKWEGIWRARPVTVAGQVLIAILAAASLPGFLGSVREILLA